MYLKVLSSNGASKKFTAMACAEVCLRPAVVATLAVDGDSQEVSPLWKSRDFLVPLRYPDVYAFRESQENLHWHAKDINLSEDARDWREKLNDNERYALLQTLGFFYRAEPIVGDNAARFVNSFEMPEAKAVFRSFANMEATHEQVYGQILEAILPSRREFEAHANGILRSTSVTAMRNFAARARSMDDTDPRRLLYMTVVEGLLFSGNFVLIFWLREMNAMKATVKANEYIARDEGVHRDACIHLFRNYVRPFAGVTTEEVYEIVDQGVRAAQDFMSHSIRAPLRKGLTAEKTHAFIRYIADHMLKSLGYPPKYNIPRNPIPFMESISLEGKTNIHEGHLSEYRARAELGESQSFGGDDEFDL